MKIAKRVRSAWSKHRGALLTLGALAGFVITNSFTYVTTSRSHQELLISTMQRYHDFYDKVSANAAAACDGSGNLQGIYLAEYRMMLAVIAGEVPAPYDNPCPTRAVPEAPYLDIPCPNTWPSFQAFVDDPMPLWTLDIGDTELQYPLTGPAKEAIANWRKRRLELQVAIPPPGLCWIEPPR